MCLSATAPRLSNAIGWSLAVALAGTAITLSRSRTAWLAFAMAAIMTTAYLIYRQRYHVSFACLRSGMPIVAVVCGAMAAIAVPNTLRWTSPNPFRESASNIFQFDAGSASVRLRQQVNTLGMVRDHSLLGVGPGNWSIEYAKYASSNDPSFDPRLRIPTNRLPHGDWIAMAAERGVPALLTLIIIGVLMLSNLLRQAGRTNPASHGAEAAAIWCIVAVGVIGLSDPVQLTPAPLFLSAVVIGLAFSSQAKTRVSLGDRARVALLFTFAVLAVRPVVYSARQLLGLLAKSDGSSDSLKRAVRLNPADYSARLTLAERWLAQSNCDSAIAEAAQAFVLIPTASAPVALIARCRGILQSERKGMR